MFDPKSFVVAIERGLHEGQRVRTRHGPGKIKLIWFGQEESAVVILDDGTQRGCGLEMDDVWPETKEQTMKNLEANYNALEPGPEVKARPIARGDLLVGLTSGNRYLIAECNHGYLQLNHIATGKRINPPVQVGDVKALARREAEAVCCGCLRNFRLVGRAEDVVTVNDPGE